MVRVIFAKPRNSFLKRKKMKNNLNLFQVVIELGNENMMNSHHVAKALQEIARQLMELDPDNNEWKFARKVYDLNGNCVGYSDRS